MENAEYTRLVSEEKSTAADAAEKYDRLIRCTGPDEKQDEAQAAFRTAYAAHVRAASRLAECRRIQAAV